MPTSKAEGCLERVLYFQGLGCETTFKPTSKASIPRRPALCFIGSQTLNPKIAKTAKVLTPTTYQITLTKLKV